MANCSRRYKLDLMLEQEPTSMSFYLTKEKHLRKYEKSELLKKLKHTLEEIPEGGPTDDTSDVIILMAAAAKYP